MIDVAPRAAAGQIKYFFPSSDGPRSGVSVAVARGDERVVAKRSMAPFAATPGILYLRGLPQNEGFRRTRAIGKMWR